VEAGVKPHLRFAGRLYSAARFAFAARLAGMRLRRLAEGASSSRDVVDLAFGFRFRDPIASFILGRDVYIDIRPAQVYEEILRLAEIVAELKPRRVLEIGTARGGTLFIWCRLASDDATVISVDLPGGPFGGGYPMWRAALYRYFRKPRQKLHLIRGDSHDPRTLEKVKKILGGGELDFLFIDRDHTYEGIRRDFEMYSPLVRRGGVVAFHDIASHDRVHDPYGQVGVPRFWNEIKGGYRHLEIVRNWGQGWAGIGVLFLCI